MLLRRFCDFIRWFFNLQIKHRLFADQIDENVNGEIEIEVGVGEKERLSAQSDA